ncbi:MAG: VCBS repeat-containing protein [Planctomycetota bacterium]
MQAMIKTMTDTATKGMVLGVLLVMLSVTLSSVPLDAQVTFVETVIPTTLPVGGSYTPTETIAGDWNQDGDIDIAFGWIGGLATVLANGVGYSSPTQYSGFGTESTVAMTQGDFNGDGIIDLVGGSNYTGYLMVRLGDGLGGFPTSTTFFSGSTCDSLATADVNLDGHLDIVSLTRLYNELSFLHGNGLGGFSPPQTLTLPIGGALLGVEDFTGDSFVDVLVFHSTAAQYTLLTNDGTGSFTTSAIPYIGGTTGVTTVVDVTGDGILDLVAAIPASIGCSCVQTYVGSGVGTFSAGPTSVATIPYAGSVVHGDFDADGHVDLAVNTDASVVLLFGDGLGAFPTEQVIPNFFGRTTATDVNGDARTDLLLSGPFGVHVWESRDDVEHRRGDCNLDGGVDIADPIHLLSFLFSGGGQPSCDDACDANDDGSMNLADAVSVLMALFGSPTVPLPAPGLTCGSDATIDAFACVSYSACP